MNAYPTNSKKHAPRRSPGLLSAAFAALALAGWAPAAVAHCDDCEIQVPSGQSRTIDEDRFADCINVESGGTLYIADGVTLTLTGGNGNYESCVNGRVELRHSSIGSRLAFSVNDHTLTGTGEIFGYISACQITLGSNNLDLTSSITIAGALQITDLDNYTNTRFINYGAVRANIAGTLEIRVDDLDDDSNDVTGSWTVDTSSDAVLWFRSGASTLLTGNFTVEDGGTLDIDVTLCTEGDLIFRDNGSEIQVASSQSFSAGGACSSSQSQQAPAESDP